MHSRYGELLRDNLKDINIDDRRNNDRYHIQSWRRLLNTEHYHGWRGRWQSGGDDREIWDDEGELSAGTPAWDIHCDAPDGKANDSSAGGRQTGGGSGVAADCVSVEKLFVSYLW